MLWTRQPTSSTATLRQTETNVRLLRSNWWYTGGSNAYGQPVPFHLPPRALRLRSYPYNRYTKSAYGCRSRSNPVWHAHRYVSVPMNNYGILSRYGSFPVDNRADFPFPGWYSENSPPTWRPIYHQKSGRHTKVRQSGPAAVSSISSVGSKS